jgi:hypothetical protein
MVRLVTPQTQANGRLIKDAAEQATIARIRQEHAAGCSYREIARRLGLGRPAVPGGRRWSPSTVRVILARGSRPVAQPS